MPNWCNNVLTLRHTDLAIMQKAKQGFENDALLQTFIPCPQVLKDTMAGCHRSVSAEQQALEAQELDNVKNHGFKNWYDWNIANWGTKWDIGGDNASIEDIDGGIFSMTMNFDSAWVPPLEAYTTLLSLGFDVFAYYYEPGMAFCGVWENGADDCYDIPGTSAEAADVIPDDIDQTFDIVNSMAMWEEDEVDTAE